MQTNPLVQAYAQGNDLCQKWNVEERLDYTSSASFPWSMEHYGTFFSVTTDAFKTLHLFISRWRNLTCSSHIVRHAAKSSLSHPAMSAMEHPILVPNLQYPKHQHQHRSRPNSRQRSFAHPRRCLGKVSASLTYLVFASLFIIGPTESAASSGASLYTGRTSVDRLQRPFDPPLPPICSSKWRLSGSYPQSNASLLDCFGAPARGQSSTELGRPFLGS